jgi:hypothetical protein
MSQHTARHEPRAKPEDEDVTVPRARQPEHRPRVRPGRPAGQPDDDGGVGPDEPDDSEFELIGDDDLGAADLGPANPNATDPDAGSGRIRKIT